MTAHAPRGRAALHFAPGVMPHPIESLDRGARSSGRGHGLTRAGLAPEDGGRERRVRGGRGGLPTIVGPRRDERLRDAQPSPSDPPRRGGGPRGRGGRGGSPGAGPASGPRPHRARRVPGRDGRHLGLWPDPHAERRRPAADPDGGPDLGAGGRARPFRGRGRDAREAAQPDPHPQPHPRAADAPAGREASAPHQAGPRGGPGRDHAPGRTFVGVLGDPGEPRLPRAGRLPGRGDPGPQPAAA